jgi:hypothetical protein
MNAPSKQAPLTPSCLVIIIYFWKVTAAHDTLSNYFLFLLLEARTQVIWALDPGTQQALSQKVTGFSFSVYSFPVATVTSDHKLSFKKAHFVYHLTVLEIKSLN